MLLEIISGQRLVQQRFAQWPRFGVEALDSDTGSTAPPLVFSECSVTRSVGTDREGKAKDASKEGA